MCNLRQVQATLLCLVFSWANITLAQSTSDLTDPAASAMETLISEISWQKAEIARLEQRLSGYEGLAGDILGERLDLVRTAMFANTLQLAESLASAQPESGEASSIRQQVIADLTALPDAARIALQRLRDRVVFPSPEMPPEEFVVADQRLMKRQKDLDDIYRVLLSYIEIAGDFDQEIELEKQLLISVLSDSAANRSAFLELAINDRATLEPTVDTLPASTNLANWYAAALARVELAAASMQDAVELMDSLDLDTSHYAAQVLQATGAITTDILDIGIATRLLTDWGTALANLVAEEGLQLIFRLLFVAAIIFAALQIARLAQKLVNRGLDASGVRISNLLRQMITSSVRNLIILFGILIGISQIGISLGPLLAGLGIAGFIIGFALQDTLGNFASGLLILFYRPFDVDDVVEAGGVSGKVSHMSLVNTTFMTFDNQKMVVPNNQIWGSVIKNVTSQTTRRVDLVFGISYEDDIEKTERILADVVASHPMVLAEPETNIKVYELGDSSVNFIVRPWVNTADYWDTYWDLTRAVKLRFDKEGISIPYPQTDVHLIDQSPS